MGGFRVTDTETDMIERLTIIETTVKNLPCNDIKTYLKELKQSVNEEIGRLDERVKNLEIWSATYNSKMQLAGWIVTWIITTITAYLISHI